MPCSPTHVNAVAIYHLKKIVLEISSP